jgi:hypothetical protein
MPRTKKKKKTKDAYELQLGNIEDRSGHRRDCSQISVRLVCKKSQVRDADGGASPEEFIAMLAEHLHDMTYDLDIWEGFTAHVTFNTQRVVAKDVKEVTA